MAFYFKYLSFSFSLEETIIVVLGRFITSLFVLLLWHAPAAIAQDELFRTEHDDKVPVFFKENYVVMELVKNQPFSTSQQKFASGSNSAFAGFRHLLRDRWLMGVHTGFKKFKLREDNSDLSIFSVLQETQLLYRINHPFYISFGPKLMFLLPTKGNKLPPKKEERYTREIGMATSVSLHLAVRPYLFLSLRMDRWRGVNRELFQGTESAFGLNVALP